MQHAYKEALAALEGSLRQSVEHESRKEGDTKTDTGSGNVQFSNNPTVSITSANGNQLRDDLKK